MCISYRISQDLAKDNLGLERNISAKAVKRKIGAFWGNMKDGISNNSTNIFSEFFIRSNQLLSISYQFSAQHGQTHKVTNYNDCLLHNWEDKTHGASSIERYHKGKCVTVNAKNCIVFIRL